MTEVEWGRLPAQALRALADDNAVVILPIASIEQHGPHLPVMTDTRLGSEIAVRAARKAFDRRKAVVTPVVWSGLSEHHMAFGGTLTVSHATFRAIITDLIAALTRQGFRDVLISNSHGGNILAMQNILDELALESDATLVGTTYVTEAGSTYCDVLDDQDGIPKRPTKKRGRHFWNAGPWRSPILSRILKPGHSRWINAGRERMAFRSERIASDGFVL